MVFLPEAVDYIAESTQKSMEMSERMDGQTMSKYCQVAKEQDIWLSVGGFHQKVGICSKKLRKLYSHMYVPLV